MTPPPVPPAIPVGEEAARKRVGDLDVDLPSMAAISNLFRAVNAARNYIERKVLRDYNLTFSGFTTLWVLWVMGARIEVPRILKTCAVLLKLLCPKFGV